jgi:hypothetical protein
MKTKLFFLATLLFAMNFSFSNNAKLIVPQNCDYLCQAQKSYAKGNCRAAKSSYKLAVKINNRYDKVLNDSINNCLSNSGETATAYNTNTELLKDLKPFDNGSNNKDVEDGNLAFRNEEYILAARYFLRYLTNTNNQNLFNKYPNKEDTFNNKIEYCLQMVVVD